MPTILLIRHGESKSNAGLPTSCPKLVELTGKGLKQAEDIAYILKSQPAPELIVTSSYLRTQQTAKQTRLAFPFVPEEEWPVHEFTYLSPSYWNEDTTSKDREPLVKAYWETCDPAYVDGPGSESFEQFIERVREVKLRLKSTEHDKIVVFSHQQFISALLWLSKRDPGDLSPETMMDFWAFLKAHPIPNGDLRRMRIRRRHESWQPESISQMFEREPVFVRR
jgi:broad specificity phosphatase PhoE